MKICHFWTTQISYSVFFYIYSHKINIFLNLKYMDKIYWMKFTIKLVCLSIYLLFYIRLQRPDVLVSGNWKYFHSIRKSSQKPFKFPISVLSNLQCPMSPPGPWPHPSWYQREHQLARGPVVHLRGVRAAGDDRGPGVLPQTVLWGPARGLT